MRQLLAASDSKAAEPSEGLARAPRSRRRILIAWLWVALWAGVIWMLGGDDFSMAKTSHTISPWLEWLIGDLDGKTRYKIFVAIRKSAHFFEYAVLALLAFRAALLSAPRNALASAAWIALFLVALLATADEARQAFSAARSGSGYDVLIDIAGGAIATLGLLVVSRRIRSGTEARAEL